MKAKNTSTWDLRILMFYILSREVRGGQAFGILVATLAHFPRRQAIMVNYQFQSYLHITFLNIPFQTYLTR